MFGSYFGHYLTEQGIITADQMTEVMQAQKSARVKVGLLAVASGLLTEQQADKINMLQQKMDKRFGDIAVEQGYLTEEQVQELLDKQGEDYSTFVQTMVDKGIMTLSELTEKVEEFKEAGGYSDAELEALKSGDIDRIVPIFMKEPALSRLHKEYAAVVMRSILRFIDTDIRMEHIEKLKPFQGICGVEQKMFGDQMLYTGIFGDKPAILDIASTFGGEDFTEVNAESLDAVAEFLNVNNGLYVTAMSGEWIELDLEPPMMYPEQKTISSEGIAYRIQVYLSGKKVNIVFSLNTDVSVD